MFGAPGPHGGGLITFLPLIIIVVIVVLSGKNRSGPVLVLREFKLNEGADEFLKIVGRAPGIFSWVLSKFGIDPVSSITCDKQSIIFEEAAIRNGKITYNIPLSSVTCVRSGISKPFVLLFLGMVFILGGIIGSISASSFAVFILGVIIGAIFIFLYSLKKTMTFGVYNGGDKPIATIYIKKSIIEGESIDEVKYGAAANALHQAVLNCRKS